MVLPIDILHAFLDKTGQYNLILCTLYACNSQGGSVFHSNYVIMCKMRHQDTPTLVTYW